MNRSRTTPAVWVWVFAALVSIPGAGATADEVRINGIWVPNVDVLRVADGQIRYVTNAGADVERPYADITGVRLDDYPKLQEAFDLIEKGEDELAIRLLVPLRSQPRGRDKWVAHEATRQTVAAYDRLGQGLRAATVYAELVEAGGGAMFLADPPVRSVARLVGDDRLKVRQRLDRAVTRVPDGAREPFQELQAAAMPGGAKPPETPGVSEPRVRPAGGAPPGPATGRYPEDGAVLLPENLGRGEVGDLVYAGRFDEAVAAADGLMRSRVTSELMYLRAMARLGRAEQTRKPADFKDAGLDFMRVLVYYPQSPSAAPALLEIAYVHDRLGLEDKADELYEQAGRALDAAEQPRYHGRYLALTAGR